VLRSGARPGDIILVTGELGVAASALAGVRRGHAAPVGLQRLRRPEPRLAEGVAAGKIGATAMIDLSDGLAIDLRRVCEASGGAVIDEEKLPLFPGADLETALLGDDYELLFTISPHRCDELPRGGGRPSPRSVR
jgi:thiamine-monophosphate kinase